MAVLFRLWLVASVCWGLLTYWAYSTMHETDFMGIVIGPPLGIFALGVALLWAFGAFRAT